MKKIFLSLFIVALTVGSVSATSNRLYFTEKNNKIYYDTDLFKEDAFLLHTEMIPGEEYVDELVVENGTKTKYDLYLKAREITVEKEDTDDSGEIDSNELLDHIIMKVELDGKVLYEGYARGIDYSDTSDESTKTNLTEGINLQNAIYIGSYGSKKASKIVVTTMLDPEYEVQDKKLTRIDWDFYANYEMINPSTLDNVSLYIGIFVGFVLILIVGLISYRKIKTI